MSYKIKDPNDSTKEIEVFTQEELKAAETKATETATSAASKVATEKAQAAIDAYKASNPDRTSEIEKLKNDLAEVLAKLETAESYDEGDPKRKEQIERLRKERDEAVTAVNKKVEELTGTIKTMQETQIATAKASLLDKYAGKDPEVRKKVEAEFDAYRPSETTPEQMDQRMQNAAKLAGVDAKELPGAMDGAGGSGGSRGDGHYGGGGTTKPTENAVNIGKNLGVSAQEMETHLAKKADEGKK